MSARSMVRTALAGALLTVLASCAAMSDLVAQPTEVLLGNQGKRVEATGLPDPSTRLPRYKDFDAVYAEFFPSTFRAHPGDTVFFRVDSRGEPHALAMGALVDRAARQVRRLGLAPLLADSESVPALRAIPSLFPLEPGEGLRINQSAAEPCYLDDGAPPNSRRGGAPPCRERAKPAFDGTHTFYGSGLLEDQDIFRLTLSDDIRPGSYYVMDLVHRSSMIARMVVVPEAKGLPSVRDQLDDLRLQSGNSESRLRTAASTAWTASDPARAVAGVGLPGTGSVIAAFSSETLQVPLGGSVTWSVNGIHSVTFDAPSDAGDGALKRVDGRVVANVAAWRPSGDRRVPAAAQAFRTSGEPVAVDGGSWDGEGDMHSGILLGSAEVPTTYTLRFTEPGTYKYHCVVHPVMTGHVRVAER